LRRDLRRRFEKLHGLVARAVDHHPLPRRERAREKPFGERAARKLAKSRGEGPRREHGESAEEDHGLDLLGAVGGQDLPEIPEHDRRDHDSEHDLEQRESGAAERSGLPWLRS